MVSIEKETELYEPFYFLISLHVVSSRRASKLDPNTRSDVGPLKRKCRLTYSRREDVSGERLEGEFLLGAQIYVCFLTVKWAKHSYVHAPLTPINMQMTIISVLKDLLYVWAVRTVLLVCHPIEEQVKMNFCWWTLWRAQICFLSVKSPWCRCLIWSIGALRISQG